LAPKDIPGSTDDVKDSIRWDITNGDDENKQWKYRESLVNQYLSVSLCARILLHKFDADKRQSTLNTTGELLKSLEIRRGEKSFACRVWVLNAVAALQAEGVIQLKIPHAELEACSKQFGDECMLNIRSGKLNIAAKGASAIPILDLRK
jgi:hypothetical protein